MGEAGASSTPLAHTPPAPAAPLLGVLLAGLAAGAAGGFFGVGGGLVMIPILTGAFHYSQHQAHGTSLAVIGVAAVVSLAVYAMHGNVLWSTAAAVAAASVFTARLGARWASRTSSRLLARAFAALLAAVALRLLLKAPEGAALPAHGGLERVGIDIALGLAIGALSGFMGVGGGLIAVPAFTLLLGMNQHVAQGTSLAVILVTAPVGALEHARHGNVVGRLVPPLALGAALGGPLASLLAQGTPQAVLARAFAAFLLFNGVHSWVRAGRKPSPTSAA